MHAHEIDKPQLFFADVIDNSPSSSFWAPSLTSKPHAMVPLDFEPPLDDITDSDSSDPIYLASRRAAKIKRRRHPYWYETQHLPYPTSMFSITPPIPPASFEDTPFEFVDTPEKLDAMVERLKQTKEIAVDLEHHSTRSFAGFTCLMQISTRERDWIVDTLKLRSELREGKLGGVMVDPSIVKVSLKCN
jgi:exosome complex exonuclease RRP6